MSDMFRTYPGTDGNPTRNLDGTPETEAQQRYFELRESGYDGWIDQDGYAVDGPTWLDRDGNPVAGFGPADSAVESRRADHQPETPADTRHHDLRESGYKGWIDGDGYAVDGPPEWPTPTSVFPTGSYGLHLQSYGRMMRDGFDKIEADIRARLLDNPRAVDVLDGVYDCGFREALAADLRRMDLMGPEPVDEP
jgi:hypothetical protein